MIGALGAAGLLGSAARAQPGTSGEARLAAFADAAAALGVRALVVANSRETLLSRGPVSEPSWVASVRKSLLSALFGMAAGEGRLSLDATLASLGIEDRSRLSQAEGRATVRHLLQARSGIYLPAASETPQMRAQRPPRGAHAPGAHFYYNNWGFNAAGEVYQRATGEGLFAAFENRLARPLGFQDFDPRRHTRPVQEPQYSRFPAHHFSLSARDLAKFGQLYLRKGKWLGRQLLSNSWVSESTTPYSRTGATGWWSGYGYMWWVASNRLGSSAAPLPPGSFTAAGNGGRYVAVLPSLDLVVAIQPEERPGQPPIPLYQDQTRLNGLLAMLL
jgi:CubicO group peptidase (beta-lactamase class C family)